jgi:nucleoside-diphosphate-sugar epimerase
MEALAFSYYRLGQTKIKVARIFNTYGPHMRLDDGRFIPTIVDCALHDKVFRRFGDGTATRSFCYVDDLVEGIWRVFRLDASIGQVINLGNPDEFTLNQAVNVLEKVSGKKLKIQEKSPLPDDPKRRQPDITKARKLLNWEPQFDLEKGLTQMLKYYV